MSRERPFILAGKPGRSDRRLEVRSPWDGRLVAATSLAGPDELDKAASAAVAAMPAMAALPAWKRADILMSVSASLARDRESMARQIVGEAGKPLRDARTEVDRATMTFRVAADEARRIGGETIPLDLAPHGERRVAITRRVPIGPIAAISPFNFPLNLTSHKLAPAIAAGNPIVLKPATKTPLSAIRLGELLADAGVPEGGVSVLPMDRATGDRLVGDERFKLLTFTGSPAVGWGMKARAGKKRLILELGGNAGVVIDETADLEAAVARVATGGFAYAGQSCISVQRVYVHDSVFEWFASTLTARVAALKVGDPGEADTDVGPMIEAAEVERIDTWVREAVSQGGRVLTGGHAVDARTYAPTILADVPERARVCADEVFAPLVVLARFSEFEEALAAVNRSAFGLQAGVFTNRLERALRAFDVLEVGGLLVNDVPTFRIDHMPYGGVKDSGLGREGPRYTIEEMTELRLLVINRTT
jgi:acyl-CoA reductase-like NAD-dependent aldehyde dehydrogenase